MITRDPDQFLKRFRELQANPLPQPWTMRMAMLVDPTGFKISEQSATDNKYMDTSLVLDLERAHAQHRSVADAIAALGVPVKVFAGKDGFEDGLYPNNAFATAPGKLIVGHMFHPVRQQETRRADIRQYFTDELHYQVVDLSDKPGVAELTGVLIIDHRLGIGYCGMTQRVDERGCANMHAAFGLRMTFMFDLVAEEYHTNIVLACLAGKGIVLYPEGIKDRAAADALIAAYGKGAVIINRDEKMHFLGNSLAITPNAVMMSATGKQAIRPQTEAAIAELGMAICWAEVDEIEKGGGSLRCLIAEIF